MAKPNPQQSQHEKKDRRDEPEGTRPPREVRPEGRGPPQPDRKQEGGRKDLEQARNPEKEERTRPEKTGKGQGPNQG